MKNIFLIFILSCIFTSLQAQKTSILRIGIEFGTMSTNGKINDAWDFREIGYKTDEYSFNQYVSGKYNMNQVGIKAELSAWKNRITFSSGLRYTYVDEMISSSNNRPQYLYLPSQDNIELFRVNEMYESLGYIGIPFEVDVVLLGLSSNWQFFVKTGIQGGIKVYENRGFDFVSNEMKINEDALIATHWKKPSNLLVNAYGNFGLRLILKGGTKISTELLFPPGYLTKNNFMLVNPRGEIGMSLSVSTPINL